MDTHVATASIHAGSIWECRRGAHKGWVVRVVKTTPRSIKIKPLKGAVITRRDPHFIAIPTFIGAYEERTAHRSRDKLAS